MGVRFILEVNNRKHKEATRWCFRFLLDMRRELDKVHTPAPDFMVNDVDVEGNETYNKQSEVTHAIARACEIRRDYGIMANRIAPKGNKITGIQIMEAYGQGALARTLTTTEEMRQRCAEAVVRNFPNIFEDKVCVGGTWIFVNASMHWAIFYNVCRLMRNIKYMSRERCRQFLANPRAQLVMLSSYCGDDAYTGDEAVFRTEAMECVEVLKHLSDFDVSWNVPIDEQMVSEGYDPEDVRYDKFIYDFHGLGYYSRESDSYDCPNLDWVLDKIEELNKTEVA